LVISCVNGRIVHRQLVILLPPVSLVTTHNCWERYGNRQVGLRICQADLHEHIAEPT
jgi:nitric oxide synthase oxygenase domain/subunit